MRYVDTHCHLDHHAHLSVAEQVERAREAGVHTLITVGTDLASSERAVATANAYEGVYAVIGVHPNAASETTPEVIAALDELSRDPVVVGIGETGLDYYRDRETPQAQHRSFRAHIDLAVERDLTLVIHCREAWDDCLRVLDEHGAPERIVMHCYSGDAKTTRRCSEAGWFQSYAGNVTFRNAQQLRISAAQTPLDLLLTETDSPFLTPHPYRGEPNDPSYLPVTLHALAEIKDQAPEQVAKAVYANARRAFVLP